MSYQRLDFEIPYKHGVFKDALLLPIGVSFSEEQIEQLKQQRLQDWIYRLNSVYVSLEGIEATGQIDSVSHANTNQE